MLDRSAEGLTCRQNYRYDWRDVILYHLSVGAKPPALEYIYEKKLKVLPTFATLACTATFGTHPYSPLPLMPTAQIPDLRNEGSLHMDHTLTIHAPLPVEGAWDIRKTITHVYDRGEGKGAKLMIDISGYDQHGALLFTNTMGYLNRWGGGFGGEYPPAAAPTMPDRLPDLEAEDGFPLNAPALYRLNGDTYPIHIDPEIAAQADLPGPIVHGLCSLGHACRLLVEALCPGQPEQMTRFSVQFRNIALPGDRYRLQIWRADTGTAFFRMVNQRNGKAILDGGTFLYR